MRLANAEGQFAEVFATIHACSEQHQAPQQDIAQFFAANWPRIEMIFEVKKLAPPVLEKTEYAWVPTEQYEDFCRAAAEEGRNLFVRKQ
jgi:hypothetical protein